jgi:hypothetical protein
MKTEVYSWRVAPEIKSSLELVARRRKISLSAVLDLAAREFLEKTAPDETERETQLRLHKAASACFGAFAGGNPRRAETATATLRQRLRRRYGR